MVQRVSRLEWAAGAVAALVLVVLTVVEPDILDAPVENTRTMVFTSGVAVLAVAAFLVMLRLGVPPALRILVVGVPLVSVTWWLLSPFFTDDVVDDDFATSIAEATQAPAAAPSADGAGEDAAGAAAPTTTAPPPAGPVLLGTGRFVGLAGHEGTGDAGFFRLEDASTVLRLERFDIQNGPDLRLYVVPGADAYDPTDDSLYLGALRGNVGDQTYELPADFALSAGDWTVLVWCEAFSVEFVAATVSIT
jgi:hypothetical protein